MCLHPHHKPRVQAAAYRVSPYLLHLAHYLTIGPHVMVLLDLFLGCTYNRIDKSMRFKYCARNKTEVRVTPKTTWLQRPAVPLLYILVQCIGCIQAPAEARGGGYYMEANIQRCRTCGTKRKGSWIEKIYMCKMTIHTCGSNTPIYQRIHFLRALRMQHWNATLFHTFSPMFTRPLIVEFL